MQQHTKQLNSVLNKLVAFLVRTILGQHDEPAMRPPDCPSASSKWTLSRLEYYDIKRVAALRTPVVSGALQIIAALLAQSRALLRQCTALIAITHAWPECGDDHHKQ